MRKAPKIKRKGYQTGTSAAGVQETDENGNPIDEYGTDTGQTQPKQKGNFMGGLGNSMGWMGYANQARGMAESTVNYDTIVDPKTGQVYQQPKTKEDAILHAGITPAHETWMNDIKSGNNKQLAADIFLTPAGGNIVRGKGGFEDPEFEKNRQRINSEINQQNALDARNNGITNYTANDTYKKPEQTAKNPWLMNKIEGTTTDLYKHPVKSLVPKVFGLAKGGEVRGKGGPKSDSINAEIEEGSFVVPAEHAHVGKMIRSAMGKKNGKANLHQKNGVPVKLSNTEIVFSPEEKETIEKELGEEFLKSLAPNAEHEKTESHHEEMMEEGMAKGGELSAEKAKTMLRDNQANGKPLTPKQKRYFGWVAGGRKMNGGEVNGYADGTNEDGITDNNPNRITSKKPPVKTGEELNKLKQDGDFKLGKTVPKKTYPKTKVFTPQPYIQKQELPANTLKTMIDQNSALAESQASNKIDTTPISDINNNTPPEQKNDFWNKVNSSGALDYLIGAAQAGIGLKNLKGNKRPIFAMDKTFSNNVDKAQQQAQYGFTPEQNALIDQNNQNLLNQEIFAAKNYAGGSAANAYNMTRSATNNAYSRGLEKQIAGTELQMDKQSNANNLLLQRNQLARQIFEDSMNAFNQKSQAGAALTQAGLNNILSANRFQNFMKLRNEENKFNNGYLNTGM